MSLSVLLVSVVIKKKFQENALELSLLCQKMWLNGLSVSFSLMSFVNT